MSYYRFRNHSLPEDLRFAAVWLPNFGRFTSSGVDHLASADPSCLLGEESTDDSQASSSGVSFLDESIDRYN